MSTATKLMTAEELIRLPKLGELYELIRGVLRTMTSAGFGHGAVEVNLLISLALHVRTHDLGMVVGGDTGFQIERDPDTVRSADVAFVAKARVAAVGITENYFPGAPDAAAEVISPNDRMSEVDDKVQQWLDAGCHLVWVINPRRREVIVYSHVAKPVILTEDDILDAQDVVPGFRMAVKDLFVSM
jgi:Uma2 family endonuclease